MTTHNPELSPRRPSTLLVAFGAALLAVVVAGAGYVAATVSNIVDAIPTPADVAAALEPEPYLEVGPVVVDSINQMAELTTVEMVEHTIVEKGTDEGWLQWARGDSVRLLAVAEIGAGVDLASITADDFELLADGGVRVTVPGAEIQYVAVDNEATQVLDRDKGLFTKGDPQLESEARRVAETILVDTAMEQDILGSAENNARTVLTNFLTGVGFESVVVEFSG